MRMWLFLFVFISIAVVFHTLSSFTYALTPTLAPQRWGDCNGDGSVGAADITAVALEVYDGDNNINPNDAVNGTYKGSVLCDANQNGVIDAADSECVAMIFFNGPNACATQKLYARGDCNGDTQVGAGDISALVLEIDDGDGSYPSDAPKGSFKGTLGCDANKDGYIDQQDSTCITNIIFDGPSACPGVTVTPTPTLPQSALCASGDLDGDRTVGLLDLSRLLSFFGKRI